MPDSAPGQLRFFFRDLVEEVQIIRDITAPFVDVSSSGVLWQLESDLEGLWSATPNSVHRWEMGDLWTTTSEGEYESGDRKGRRPVVACVSSTWAVRPLGPNVKKSKGRMQRLLEFAGIASTRVRLFYADDRDTPIAMWRMELGDHASPGCFFHAQVLGEEDCPPFPKNVPVPRLPTVFVTPMGAVEYVLGELFQDRWAKAAQEQGGSASRWSSLQRTRLSQLLKWQRTTIEQSLTSPWMALKMAKPSAELFLE